MKAWDATVRKTQTAKKRANSLFGLHLSANAVEGEISDQDEERPSGQVYHAEKVLPNGDYYKGYWIDNIPHGNGKYRWGDGCIYVGEWFRGKTMGKGTFSWPSGAMYKGNFKSGYMDGEGTYTSPNGYTYKGSWVMNIMHGQGLKEYANGDVYEGQWSRGFQEGKGKYTWKNGNCYDGGWKNGVICGEGTMHWSNGSLYEGQWEDGLPEGNGTFKWDDGSYYVGNWSKNPNEQNGNFFPSGSMIQDKAEWDPQEVFNNLMDCNVCKNEKILTYPSQKKLEIGKSSKPGNPVTRQRQRRRSVDGRIDALMDKELLTARASYSGPPSSSSAPGSPERSRETKVDNSGVGGGGSGVGKKQGDIICKGHKNYELMLNLQLGIRHAVGRPGPQPSLNLRPSAFDPKEKYWTRFPPEGSKHTPPHTSSEFKWKDYCPKVFRTLRMIFKVDPADYMLSICGDNALRELSSPGKSGSFFYLTSDDRYMIKTMKKAEMKALLRMLSAYYNHVRSFNNTLLTKYFGLHSVKLGPTQKKVRFIVMGNLFCTSYKIHRRYDLKGSTIGRFTSKPESQIDANTTLKDLDLNYIFKLQKAWFQEFIRQVDRDSELLEQERIMDYSLLVGLHFREAKEDDQLTLSGPITPNGDGASDGDNLIPDPAGWGDIKLGVEMPARVERTERKNDGRTQLIGEPTGQHYDVVMFFSIIDILQDYDVTKKLEHAYKSIHNDSSSISAVDPKQYSRRFRDYIFKVFAEDS